MWEHIMGIGILSLMLETDLTSRCEASLWIVVKWNRSHQHAGYAGALDAGRSSKKAMTEGPVLVASP
jgi:hypothetical protein